MAKYSKKPVEIEAVQWTGSNLTEIEEFTGLTFSRTDRFGAGMYLLIPTLEGVMTASPDDWIIKGVNGEFYPCKPDIFEKTYESVEIKGMNNSDLRANTVHVLFGD